MRSIPLLHLSVCYMEQTVRCNSALRIESPGSKKKCSVLHCDVWFMSGGNCNGLNGCEVTQHSFSTLLKLRKKIY